MAKPIVATVTGAGFLTEEYTEPRFYDRTVRKGGWISLFEVDTDDGECTERIIAVTRERAIQAMNNIEKGRQYA